MHMQLRVNYNYNCQSHASASGVKQLIDQLRLSLLVRPCLANGIANLKQSP